jgi:hypothetical protein
MTKKKRFFLIAILPLTIALTLGVLAMLPPRPGVTKANFDRIQDGMTMAEVEEIFGAYPEFRVGHAGNHKTWRNPNGSLAHIWFDTDLFGENKVWVSEKEWHDSDETILDKLRRWLHLR